MEHTANLAPLTHEIEVLKAENALLNARCKQYEEAYEYLKEQMLEMKRQIFGKRC